ncbi:SCO family protein [Rhodopila sp.]|uniref:SCO family protein n=1 Tax=Rhodopila sp. TaxID=2480087 RepID=UPI003D1509E4
MKWAALRGAVTAVALLLPAAGHAAPDNPLDYAWKMNRGAQVPLGVTLHDEAGRDTTLGATFAGKPVILDIGYFHCPTLCGVVRADLLAALGTSGLREGRDYSLVSVSIDPKETSKDAADAKAADLAQAPFASGADWHYLTGPAAAVAAVKAAVGFRDRYDERFRQFLHPAGLVVLTKAGIVSGYLQGVGYSGGELRAAVLRAGQGGIAQAALPILLLCFHFDSSTGRYTLAIVKLLRLAGGLTVLTIVGLLVVLHRNRPAPPP